MRRAIQEAPLLGEGYADPVPKNVNSQEAMWLAAACIATPPNHVLSLYYGKTVQKGCISGRRAIRYGV